MIDHKAELIELAEQLMEHNSLSTKQIMAILGPNGHNPDQKKLESSRSRRTKDDNSEKRDEQESVANG